MDTQTAADDTSFAAHLLAEEPTTPLPASPPPAPPVDVLEAPETPAEPEVEAASVKPDAELSEAAKTLRRNRADERKAKIQSEIAEAIKERETLRAENSRLRAERDAPAPAKARETTDPGDPRPTLDQYDDFNAFVDARDEWVLRESARRSERAGALAAESRAEAAHAEVLAEKGRASREKYSDYLEVIEPVIAQFNANPRAKAVAEFVANSDVGGDVIYRLGKDPALLSSVLTAASPFALATALARIESSIAQPVRVAPQTKAPAPPQQTVGGSAAAQTPDTRRGVPLADHIRIEEAEIAARRRQGHRY